MKKIYILTAVFALLALSLNAQTMAKKAVKSSAQAGIMRAPNRDVASVTICDGTSTSQYVPFYGGYTNRLQINQMIYPESLLTDLVGTEITSLTFYATNTFNSNLNNGVFTFKIGTTTQSTYSTASRITTGMTAVATGVTMSSCFSGTQFVIDFSSNPFTYEGGNLVLDYQLTTATNNNATTNFYGESRTGASFYSRASRTSSNINNNGVYSGQNAVQNFLPKMTIGYIDATPKIEASPETLTINDSGTNNTFTVQGSNLGTDNVGVTTGNGFSTTTSDQSWGFNNNNGSVSGTVTVTYEGRDLSATGTVSVANNLTSTTVTVNYKPDLYIYCDYGVSPWNFSANPAVAMTNLGNGIYSATLGDLPANSHILFGRTSGLTYYWEGDENRLFIGASTGGEDWGYGDYTWGYLDTDPRNDNPVKYHPIYFSEGGTYTITINANDYTFSIEKLVLPPPENVTATADSEHQKATVTWNAPSTLPTVMGTVYETVTEGFDDTSKFEPFSVGGISTDNHIGTIGGWTLYDPTGAIVWGIEDGSFPGMMSPHAWFVMNPSHQDASGINITPNSPAQYMESICPLTTADAAEYNAQYGTNYTGHDGPNDHWLISPELSGNAQTISFYERIITTGYAPGYETYEILVSSNDINSTDPSSGFTVLQTVNSTETTWALRSFNLPAGTKHFAIHHISNNVFGMMVDDVTYEIATIGQVTLNPESYNVYLDGELVGNVPANEARTYTFSNLAAGDYECAVSAVYPGNLESEAVPAEFTIIERTATPIIHVEANADGSKTITVEGNGEVHLYVDGNEVTSPYTIMPSTEGDMAYTVTATAQEEGKLISETAEQIVTVAEGGRTPKPAITIVEHNGYVVITAYGDGTVTLTAGGQTVTGEGSASITIVKSNEEQEVSITATAVAEGLEESRPATQEYTVPALNTTPTNPVSGLLRLHLLIVDQMKQDIPADNSHPNRYSYILRYEPNGVGGTGTKESGTVHVDIQKADCEVMGAYTLTEVDNDKNIGRDHDQGITMNVISADVEYDLSSDNDILYAYLLQGAENRLPNYQADYLTELQKTQNFTYVEMEETNPNKGTEYPNGEHHYFVGTKNPETGVYENLKTGAYGEDYISYAPSVSTWGISRRYYEDDGYDNTYGAPIWKTAAGKVIMDDSELKAEKQTNAWNSVNWTTDAGSASLFILDGVKAIGLLPHTSIATVEYEPYMFRIFVESPSGKLRPYKTVEAGDGDNDGEHLEALVPDDQLTDAQKYGPISVWDGYIKYGEDESGKPVIIGTDAANGVMVSEGKYADDQTQTAYSYTKNKVDRPNGSHDQGVNNDEWNQDSNNAMFGALDAILPASGKISTNDLKVFVRFYYAVKGEIADHTVGTRAEGSRSGNGAESSGSAAGAATSVFEISYHGEIVGQTYFNIQGMESDKPFDGVNIVVTRYSDGATSISKVVK